MRNLIVDRRTNAVLAGGMPVLKKQLIVEISCIASQSEKTVRYDLNQKSSTSTQIQDQTQLDYPKLRSMWPEEGIIVHVKRFRFSCHRQTVSAFFGLQNSWDIVDVCRQPSRFVRRQAAAHRPRVGGLGERLRGPGLGRFRILVSLASDNQGGSFVVHPNKMLAPQIFFHIPLDT